MKILTLLCHKGGVGKTTMTMNIGAGLAARGYRVCIVDADPQGSLTVACGLQRRGAFYDLIERDALFEDTLLQLPETMYCPDNTNGYLVILPGNAETDNINVQRRAGQLRDRLQMLKRDFDVIIIDTNPSPSKLHVGAYLATDYIIYPVSPEKLPVQGLIDSFDFTNGAQELRVDFGYRKIKVAGVIVNKYRQVTALHEVRYEKIKERFGDLVMPPIGNRIAWGESMEVNQPVYAYAPGSKAALELYEVIDKVEGIICE